MSPLTVDDVDLGPRRRQEDALVAAVRMPQRAQRDDPTKVVESDGCIDQAPVEEHPAAFQASNFAIFKRQLDGALTKRDRIFPRQCRAAGLEFLSDDATSWLLDDMVATPL